MIKAINSVKQFFITLWYFKRYLKAKSYERKIRKGILDREAEKIMILHQASKLIPLKTKKGKSDYIPFTKLSKARIKAVILREFGYKMKVLGMKITDDLKFI